MITSKVEPTADSLKQVGKVLLEATRDTLTLYCEGCGSVYRVSRRRADEGRLNWFACPGGKHGRTQD